MLEHVANLAILGQSLELGDIPSNRFPCLALSGIEAEALYSQRRLRVEVQSGKLRQFGNLHL